MSSLEEGDNTDFCSVGHTVVGYQLDGYSFSTLTGHKGKLAGVDLIATFLPSEVVESLYTTMSMLGLSIASMTLEPIAAMNAVVPKELRLLNIALVDVGAGTSDIAVADRGSICGYTMATVAGDEVTERVMQELLVDFSTAEQIKFAASAGTETIEYTDILGLSVPSITIPVKPGRNLAMIIEVAAMNNRQKKLGYNAAHELLARLGMAEDIPRVQRPPVTDYEEFYY